MSPFYPMPDTVEGHYASDVSSRKPPESLFRANQFGVRNQITRFAPSGRLPAVAGNDRSSSASMHCLLPRGRVKREAAQSCTQLAGDAFCRIEEFTGNKLRTFCIQYHAAEIEDIC
jgi:hypothetical protein